jgi:hypothetical protein
MCGADDPSMHLAINLEGHGWKCWRRPEKHFGRNPARLVAVLINCNIEEARRLTDQPVQLSSDFLSSVKALYEPPPTKHWTKLKIPKEFKPITSSMSSAKPYKAYLKGRGFELEDLEPFKLHYCNHGPYGGRIIIPIYYNGDLVTWTGRAIQKSARMRYKTLSQDFETAAKEGMPPAQGPISDYLLSYDDLMRNKKTSTIYLVEGPFDSIKMQVLGRDSGVTATCFFTAAPSKTQINLLHELLPRFRHRYLLLDQGTIATSLSLESSMASLVLVRKTLPDGFKDPGEINEQTFRKFSY